MIDAIILYLGFLMGAVVIIGLTVGIATIFGVIFGTWVKWWLEDHNILFKRPPTVSTIKLKKIMKSNKIKYETVKRT